MLVKVSDGRKVYRQERWGHVIVRLDALSPRNAYAVLCLFASESFRRCVQIDIPSMYE